MGKFKFCHFEPRFLKFLRCFSIFLSIALIELLLRDATAQFVQMFCEFIFFLFNERAHNWMETFKHDWAAFCKFRVDASNEHVEVFEFNYGWRMGAGSTWFFHGIFWVFFFDVLMSRSLNKLKSKWCILRAHAIVPPHKIWLRSFSKTSNLFLTP